MEEEGLDKWIRRGSKGEGWMDGNGIRIENGWADETVCAGGKKSCMSEEAEWEEWIDEDSILVVYG